MYFKVQARKQDIVLYNSVLDLYLQRDLSLNDKFSIQITFNNP